MEVLSLSVMNFISPPDIDEWQINYKTCNPLTEWKFSKGKHDVVFEN